MWGIRPHHQIRKSPAPAKRDCALEEREPGVFDPVGSTLKFGKRREAPLTGSFSSALLTRRIDEKSVIDREPGASAGSSKLQ
ncbi:MAG: hypothetical protein ABIT01_18240 [Thermoanaerobaculia bacterium]